ncbi:MAG TPA: helix-turn-helix domain-containing protein [Caulobacteraceae bacterium]|jgi:transcriptional regulator with XRE-family HTH domain|nr:helix-turn-helix domain-containing protein [Caulobacteraceae bacterium]
MNDLLDTRTPNPVDLHVGARIRLRRRMQGVSQEKLADALGLTFQQVQKYERGANRVSASKLYEIAAALKAPVAYFFDGLADPTTDGEANAAGASDEQTVHAFLMTAEGLELARLFPALTRGRVRRRFLDLMRALAGVDEGDDEDREG